MGICSYIASETTGARSRRPATGAADASRCTGYIGIWNTQLVLRTCLSSGWQLKAPSLHFTTSCGTGRYSSVGAVPDQAGGELKGSSQEALLPSIKCESIVRLHWSSWSALGVSMHAVLPACLLHLPGLLNASRCLRLASICSSHLRH